MKTTIEIPDSLYRGAKARAAERGQTFRELFMEALREKLGENTHHSGEPEWMRGFGKLRALRKETAHLQSRIDKVFDVVEREDRL